MGSVGRRRLQQSKARAVSHTGGALSVFYAKVVGVPRWEPLFTLCALCMLRCGAGARPAAMRSGSGSCGGCCRTYPAFSGSSMGRAVTVTAAWAWAAARSSGDRSRGAGTVTKGEYAPAQRRLRRMLFIMFHHLCRRVLCSFTGRRAVSPRDINAWVLAQEIAFARQAGSLSGH